MLGARCPDPCRLARDAWHHNTKGCRSLGYRFVHGVAVGNIAYHPDLRNRLCSAGSQLLNWGKDRRRLRPQFFILE